MNWFTKIFSQKPKKTPLEKEPDIAPLASTNNPLTYSEPVSTEYKKLPLTTLKRLAPLRDMDDAYVEQLAHTILKYTQGSVIFRLGQKTSSVFYLLEGSVELQPDSDNRYTLSAESSLANLPLNSGKVCGATAFAKTDITILAISGEFICRWSGKSLQEPASVELIDIELPEQIANNRFFTSFSKAYRENRLSLPSLPNVALKLKEAMEKDLGINEVVRIIGVDASIVAKLIQLANSPLYSPISPITNCHAAVTRLGLDQTRKLVMGISLKQLFSCQNPQLMEKMQNLWKNSLYVSSLSFVLAQENGTVNPEDALLAGLVSDIGTIPVLHFAELNPNEYPNMDILESAIPFLSPSVGSLVLHTLGFTPELTDIPKYAENWFYESDRDKLNLTDIVILAKLHSYFGTSRAKEIPYMNSIPAYVKLNNSKLTPDFSLDILHKAKHRINAAMNFLS
ncbi:HDOD domain-containing protein [Methylobacter sp.]|uniref:HDOD domain-containing protein n=1 Tax=Methylobacter sp. TaxID=2051955 RepID=UPI00121DE626|nr:HDOD domain-containing protein [Methylobacter sp.]TAK63581.1 MAG: HDOD domain-containing protein [Methylobacter sp.]